MAADEEEAEICRVCRGPATPEQPLHYPCKCSGSMRYVHQDCLEQWLQHSRKKQCEICNYPFSFTSIYSEHAPERISIPFFLNVISRRMFSLARLYLRAFLAASIWLVGVPYITVWIWRMHFNPAVILQLIGDADAFTSLSAVFEYVMSDGDKSEGTPSNFTLLAADSSNSTAPTATNSLLSSFFTDVFEGQIIASIAVVICLAFLCLREYVVMNTPLDGQGNPVNAPDVAVAVAAEAEPAAPEPQRPDVPIFGRRDLVPLNDLDDINAAHVNLRVAEAERRPAADAERPFEDLRSLTAAAAQRRLALLNLDFEQVAPRSDDSLDRACGSAVELTPTSMGIRRRKSGGESSQNSFTGFQFLEPDTSSPDSPSLLDEDGLSESHSPKSILSRTVPLSAAILDNDDPISDEDPDSDQQLLARERKLISAAGYDELQFRRRMLAVEQGKGKGPVTNAEEENMRDIGDGTDSEPGPLNRTRSRLELAATDYDLGLKRVHSSSSSLSRSGRPSVVNTDTGAYDSSSSEMSPSSHNYQEPPGYVPTSMHVVQAQLKNRRWEKPRPVDFNLGEPRPERGDIERQNDGPLATNQVNEPAHNAPPGRPVQGNINPPAIAVAPAPQPIAPPIVPAALADADDNPGIGNNDVNAFLELVGVQGPLENLAQNVVMVLLIISVALFVGVWTPYWIGRGVTYIVRDVYAPILQWGIGWLQGLTDPVLDPLADLAFFVARLLGFGRVAKTTTDIVSKGDWSIPSNFNVSVPQNLTDKHNEALPPALAPSPEISKLSDVIPQNNTAFVVQAVQTDYSNFSISTSLSDGAKNMSETPITAPAAAGASEARKPAAHPEGAKIFGIPEKILYTAIGYFTQCFFIIDYARRTGLLQHPYAQTMKRITIKWMLYLIMAVKFSFFLTVELGVFPLFCGILIDICTLPLFGPHATMASRWAFYRAHPWTSEFLHWVAGTTFMFQFALYVSTVREIVRPGVMWFIRDPNDEQFHPMNDILERPVLTQLKKLAVGTVMYATMVIGGVGGVVGLIWCSDRYFAPAKGPSRMWPLQWDLSEPMSEFPVDLLIFHFVVPWTIAWIRPKRMLRQVVDVWFRWTAEQLRLQSFMFGGPAEMDESDDEVEIDEDEFQVPSAQTLPEQSYDPTVDEASDSNLSDFEAASSSSPARGLNTDSGNDGDDEGDASDVSVGSVVLGAAAAARAPVPPKRTRPRREFRYMRVPNNDHVEVIPGERMLIPIRDEDPVRGREGETEEEVRLNWTKVYVPANFKTRIAVLLYMQWGCGVVLVSALITFPLYVGRLFFIEATARIPRLDIAAATHARVNATAVINATTAVVNSLAANVTAAIAANTTIPADLNGGNASTVVEAAAGAANATAKAIARKIVLRADLPVHDMYSYAVGLFLLFVAIYPVVRVCTWVSTWNRGSAGSPGSRRAGGGGRRLGVNAAVQTPLVPIGAADEAVPAHPHHRPARRTPWRRLVRRGARITGRWLTVAAKVAFLGLMFGVVLPLMAGVVFDLYLIQPFKPLITVANLANQAAASGIPGAPPPRFPQHQHRRHIGIDLTNPLARTLVQALLQDWALGAVYMKIAWALIMVGPETAVQRALRELVENGLRRVRVGPVWRAFIMPASAACAALAAGPLLAGLAVQKLFVTRGKTVGAEVLRWAFPCALLMAICGVAGFLAVGAVRRWMERIREEQFLVGRRLHNLEESQSDPGAGGRSDGGDAAAVVADPVPVAPPPPPLPGPPAGLPAQDAHPALDNDVQVAAGAIDALNF
ncbi:E3 ubiquitin-protein ligase march7 [Geranomyces variabilis]|uniref:RING-type E3 ubiquitin transferase n=1 Tax=Geranomyces variabilis TaxID=109894 RepID=A0AAD5TGC2_9FUNG|nr:E3 ubiquitin-protein ligase march7 [Geranomyces variabilis]